MMENNTVKEILAAGAAVVAVHHVEGVPVLVVPEGYRAEKMEALLPHPTRKRATVTLAAIASLIQYVNLHKTDSTIILADINSAGAKFTAVLDHHSKDKANHREHIATYTCKHSVEWNRWMKINDKSMAQVPFAEAIEENMDSIIEPDGAKLLELVQNIAGKSDVTFVSATNLMNGSSKFTYDETVKLTSTAPGATRRGDITIPSKLGLAISPFENTNRIKFNARLKHRLDGGKLFFQVESIDTHHVIEDAVNGLIKLVKEKTGIDVLLGSTY